MNKPESYEDLIIKRQAMLERLKSGQVKDFQAEIKKLEQSTRRAIGAAGGDLSALSRNQLEVLLKDLKSEQRAILGEGTGRFLNEAEQISKLYAAQEVADLVSKSSVIGTQLEKFSGKSLFAKVLKRPLTTQGLLLEPWVKRFTESAVDEVSGSIRNGYNLGQTNREITKKVVGATGANFRGSTMAKIRRNASTVVRTAVQHVASSARQEIWEANPELIKKYKFVATLDGSTSRICRSLDLKEFELEKGPVPPLHPNCRSTTVPVLADKYKFLNEGQTRSAEFGPVDGNQSYYEWLKGQPASVQKQVLGKSRAALFQSMDAKKFGDLQFDKTWTPMTLGQMQKLEPTAFKKAGIFTKAAPVVPVKVKPKAPKGPNISAKEAARRKKFPIAQEVLDLEAGGMHLGDDLSFLNLMPRKAKTPLKFKFPTTGKGQDARFQPAGNEGVMIETNKRFAKETGNFPSILSHEVGHAIDNAHGWTTGHKATQYNWAEGRYYAGEEVKGPNPIFTSAWKKAKALVRKKSEAEMIKKYQAHGATGMKRHRMVDLNNRGKLPPRDLRGQRIWGEQENSLSDTIQALTNNKWGEGHYASYVRVKFNKEAEFMAHAFENKFVGNPAFKLHEPELHKIMDDMMTELIEETNKLNK